MPSQPTRGLPAMLGVRPQRSRRWVPPSVAVRAAARLVEVRRAQNVAATRRAAAAAVVLAARAVARVAVRVAAKEAAKAAAPECRAGDEGVPQ